MPMTTSSEDLRPSIWPQLSHFSPSQQTTLLHTISCQIHPGPGREGLLDD